MVMLATGVRVWVGHRLGVAQVDVCMYKMNVENTTLFSYRVLRNSDLEDTT
jgi:hypothetical protein